jgi:hypothetical protein
MHTAWIAWLVSMAPPPFAADQAEKGATARKRHPLSTALIGIVRLQARSIRADTLPGAFQRFLRG